METPSSELGIEIPERTQEITTQKATTQEATTQEATTHRKTTQRKTETTPTITTGITAEEYGKIQSFVRNLRFEEGPRMYSCLVPSADSGVEREEWSL